MKPSSLSTWAMRIFTFVQGISTAGASVRLAFRTRVSISAIGSVIMVGLPLVRPVFHQPVRLAGGKPAPHVLPACLLDTRNQALVGHATETDPADAELAINRTGPAAKAATQADFDPVARSERRRGW